MDTLSDWIWIILPGVWILARLLRRGSRAPARRSARPQRPPEPAAAERSGGDIYRGGEPLPPIDPH